MSCQLKYLEALKTENSLTNDLRQKAINKIRPLKGNLIFLKRGMMLRLDLFPKTSTDKTIRSMEIKAGDLVRVRSKKDINNILDNWRMYKGCSFMDEMYQYCGRTFKVLKAVHNFYDEANQRLVKCRDILILEDVICSGRRTLYKERCDRNCFLFWHTAWLDKI